MAIEHKILEKAKTMDLPPLPWTHKALGEDLYCHIAVELGYFNPKTEPANYRPSLDPTPFLGLLKAKTNTKKSEE